MKIIKEGYSDDATSYGIYVEGTNKRKENKNVPERRALNEILQFIMDLSSQEKENVGCWWVWLNPDGTEGDIVVSIYGPSEDPDFAECGARGDRTLGNWPYAEQQIQKALGIKSLY
jgi:hypothetical protein